MFNFSELNQEALALDAKIHDKCAAIAEMYRAIGALEVEIRKLRQERTRLLVSKPAAKEATS